MFIQAKQFFKYESGKNIGQIFFFTKIRYKSLQGLPSVHIYKKMVHQLEEIQKETINTKV